MLDERDPLLREVGDPGVDGVRGVRGVGRVRGVGGSVGLRVGDIVGVRGAPNDVGEVGDLRMIGVLFPDMIVIFCSMKVTVDQTFVVKNVFESNWR